MKQAMIFIIILFICGCGQLEPVPPTPSVLTYIVVTPPTVKLAKSSGQYKFTAKAYDQNSYLYPTVFNWRASIEAGTIAQSGNLTVSSEAGTGEVIAYVETIEGKARATVTNGTLSTITLDPFTTSVLVGVERHFIATGRDSLGNTVALDPLWSATIGSIDQDGYFISNFGGTGFVYATQASKTGQASVTITTLEGF